MLGKMIKPHGGKLVNRVLKGEEHIQEAQELEKLEINKELFRDLENIATGVFSPLEGFLLREDLENVILHKRLGNDTPWTIPIILGFNGKGVKVKEGDALLLKAGEGMAILDVEEIYPVNKDELTRKIFGTDQKEHPGVNKIYQLQDSLLGGKIKLLREQKSEYEKFALKPVETRVLFKEKGWRTIVGFQTRNVPHVGHEYVQKTALTFVDGIFINPVIGKKKPGDFLDKVILDSYAELIRHYYLKNRAVMAILQTEMRYAGPREAIFHAIIRKNFGCTHFIIGRDHAGVGNFYGPYEAQEIFEEFPDLGIIPLFFRSFFYCKKCGGVANEKTCPHGEDKRINFSGTKIRELLSQGKAPPKEMMREEVTDIILNEKNIFVK